MIRLSQDTSLYNGVPLYGKMVNRQYIEIWPRLLTYISCDEGPSKRDDWPEENPNGHDEFAVTAVTHVTEDGREHHIKHDKGGL